MREKTNINYYGINAGQSGNHSMHNNFVILQNFRASAKICIFI